MFTKEITNRAAMDFKMAFNDALSFAGMKQEALAITLGVTQSQINNWLNPHSDRNFPMALFPMLPVAMRRFLMDYTNKRCDGREHYADLDGSVNDELVNMIMLEGDLKRQSESDPKKAKQTVIKMKEMLGRIERELETMQGSAR